MNTLPKIGAPANRALASIGVFQLSDLTKHSASEIANLHGMGPKALKILGDELRRQDLSFNEK